MGILRLAALIREEAPGGGRCTHITSYRGKVLAIDASVFICQFDLAKPEMRNRHGQNLSVLQGFFDRTVFMLMNGIKPLYVFDGIPPAQKRVRVSAGESVQDRSVIRAPDQTDLKTLLTHLGVPFIQAPSEAEATCASLVRNNLAWGAVTEDMDALPLGCTRLIRGLTADKKKEITEYNYAEILQQLQLGHAQFVDLCILLGCDYTEKIRGLGIKKALKMIKEYGDIERILPVISPQDSIPPGFHLAYLEARRLFLNPAVASVSSSQLKWTKPDEEKVLQFLSNEKCMNRKRVENGLRKLRPVERRRRKRKAGSEVGDSTTRKQRRMSEYFPVVKSPTQDKTSQRDNVTA